MIHWTIQKTRKFSSLLLIILSLTLTLGVLTLSYYKDNKYTYPSVQPIGGIIFLDRNELEKTPFLYLINGWEYYADQLLSPEDFRSRRPILTQYVAIGQYTTLSAGRPSYTSHGSGTYRLTLVLPPEPMQYTLELPEIFSAYHLYINGKLMASRGNPLPDAYTPEIRSGSITFEAAGDTEILLSVSDFSYFYSGLIYPPAFGMPDAVSILLDSRIIFSLSVCVVALFLGLFNFCLGIALKKIRFIFFALICFCTIGTSSYPVFHHYVSTGIQPWYTLELFCRYAIYLLIILLANDLCKVPRLYRYLSTIISGSFCLVAICVSLLTPLMPFYFLLLFSKSITLYKWSCSLYLIIICLRAATQQIVFAKSLLIGVCIFATSLIADRLFPFFEPMRLGWFIELSGIGLIIILEGILWTDTLSTYRRRFALEEEAKQTELQLAMQYEHYQSLSTQIETARSARHDLRHHLTLLNGFLKENNLDEAKEYLCSLGANTDVSSELSFCNCYSLDVLLRHYNALACSQDIPIHIKCFLPDELLISSNDLCVIIGNLLENALEACSKSSSDSRFITLNVFSHNSTLTIEVKNSYNEVLQPDNDTFYSSKRPGRRGVGLKSVKAIALKYEGDLWLLSEPPPDLTFTAQVLLMNQSAI